MCVIGHSVPAQTPNNTESDRETSARWQVSLVSERLSDPLPLQYFGQPDWAAHVQPRSGRNLVQVNQSLSMTRVSAAGTQQWSWVARQLGRIVLDEDTARRMAQIATGQDAAQNWHGQHWLTYKSFSGQGIDWKYQSAVSEGFYADGGVQVLVLRSLSARSLDGEVNFNTADGRYAFNVQTGQSGNKLSYPFQKPFDAQGQALLLQGRLGWRAGPWHVSGGVRDAGWLRWQGLPHQALSLNSQTQTRDANGYIVWQPLVQGQNSQTDVRWGAPWTGDMQLGWRASAQQSWSLPWQYVPQVGWLPALRWQGDGAPVRWAVTWRQHQRDVTGQVGWGPWRVALALGNTSHSQQLELAYAQNF